MWCNSKLVYFQSNIDDIHVICGCLKDFLRGLKEPLVTFKLWKTFVHAAGKCILLLFFFISLTLHFRKPKKLPLFEIRLECCQAVVNIVNNK